MPVAEEDRPKTAFTSPFGKFEFNRMPFRLKGAPSTFQRLMDWLEQMVMPWPIWMTGHLQLNLGPTSEGLRGYLQEIDCSWTDKCQFAKAECTFLGHVVGRGDIKPRKTSDHFSV